MIDNQLHLDATVTERPTILPIIFDDPDIAERFAGVAWPAEPLVVHGDPRRFATVAEILTKLDDVEVILAGFDGLVTVSGRPVIEASGGVADRFLVAADRALHWYQQGAALELDFFEMRHPELRRRAYDLRGELGLWPGALAKCVVYCATAEGGLAPHFDAYMNIILQLRGTKQWRLAPNQNVVDPVQHYDLSEAPHVPDELSRYWRGDPPSRDLVEGSDTFLQPGSVLLLPRGVWHSTRSSAPTVSLNFTFSQPVWADVVLAALRRLLVSEQRWRELARPTDLGRLRNLAKELSRIHLDIGVVLREAGYPLDQYQEIQAVMRQLMDPDWTRQ